MNHRLTIKSILNVNLIQIECWLFLFFHFRTGKKAWPKKENVEWITAFIEKRINNELKNSLKLCTTVFIIHWIPKLNMEFMNFQRQFIADRATASAATDVVASHSMLRFYSSFDHIWSVCSPCRCVIFGFLILFSIDSNERINFNLIINKE